MSSHPLPRRVLEIGNVTATGHRSRERKRLLAHWATLPTTHVPFISTYERASLVYFIIPRLSPSGSTQHIGESTFRLSTITTAHPTIHTSPRDTTFTGIIYLGEGLRQPSTTAPARNDSGCSKWIDRRGFSRLCCIWCVTVKLNCQIYGLEIFIVSLIILKLV